MKLTCKNRQETNISRAQLPKSVLPENTRPPPTATASWDSGGLKRASRHPPCKMGLRGSLRPRANMQLTKEQIEMGTGDNAKWPYDPAVS